VGDSLWNLTRINRLEREIYEKKKEKLRVFGGKPILVLMIIGSIAIISFKLLRQEDFFLHYDTLTVVPNIRAPTCNVIGQ